MEQNQNNMITVNPYLHFMGQAEAAMKWYKAVLGGEFAIFQRYRDIPGGEKMSEEDQEKMMHISLVVNKATTIMASDSVKPMGDDIMGGNNFHICIQAESEEEVDRIFAGLSKNGRVEMPPNKTFWGAYFSMCTDKFGIRWMINYTETK
jgi:PhnB protein